MASHETKVDELGQCEPGRRGASGRTLSRRGTLRSEIHRVERLAGGYEKPVAFGAAKAQIGSALRQSDAADQFALRCPNGHTAIAEVAAGITRNPHIAVNVAPCSIWSAF